MSNRGMKKWAPYSSLIEQSIVLEKVFYEKNKITKPSISNERASKINQILSNYNGEKLKISYFHDGYIYEMETVIKRIDVINRKLIFEDGIIPFSQIVDIN